jgi:hypothetical protein
MIKILREYTLDDSDGSVEEYNGFYIYEVDGHYEVQDANGDFVVSADTPREARFEIDKYIDDNILNDGCGSSKRKKKISKKVSESLVTDREKEILDIYGKSIWDMSNEELIEYDLTDDWAKLVDAHYDWEESED